MPPAAPPQFCSPSGWRILLQAEPAGARPGSRRQGSGLLQNWRPRGRPLGYRYGFRARAIPTVPEPLGGGEGKQPRALTAPTRPPSAAAAVAMRCRETPVNKSCLDSGARAQGLFA